MSETVPSNVSRRAVLKGALVAGAAGVTAGAVGLRVGEERAGASEHTSERVAFSGRHQPGVVTPAPSSGLLAALDVTAKNRAELADTLRTLSTDIEHLMSGRLPDAAHDLYPPAESGILGSKPESDNLSMILGVGPSLFDKRFGLDALKPRQLVEMPLFPNDRIDQTQAHGDLLLEISANHQDTVLHAFRYLLRSTRSTVVLRWMVEGYNRSSGTSKPGTTGVRNLMGFKDGTANLDASDESLMNELVWVQPTDSEPAWAVGGSYAVVRIIRMFVEFWDRTSLNEQQNIMGRQRANGAPLDGNRETDEPNYVSDPEGNRIPLDAHIRLANPRTPDTAKSRILRRGLSFSRGFDAAGQLDQGLAFVCFQRDLEAGFVTVQKRLDGEPLEEYIKPVGGGYFYVLPGVGGAAYLGESLLRT